MLTSQRCQFIGNAATRGGAVYGIGADMTFVDTAFQSNFARTTAGAIFAEAGGELAIQRSNFTSNQAGELAPAQIRQEADLAYEAASMVLSHDSLHCCSEALPAIAVDLNMHSHLITGRLHVLPNCHGHSTASHSFTKL